MIDKKLLLSGLLLTLIMVAGVPAAQAAANVVEISHTIGESKTNGVPNGKIFATVTLKNIGDVVASDFIYEMQPLGVASFSVITSQGVCRSGSPENQYRGILKMQPGEQVTFTIESPKLVRAIYNVYGVSFSNCCWEGTASRACSPVQPYGPSGSKLLGQVSNSGGPTPPVVACGDGVCQTPESVSSCPGDCPGSCNDAVCNSARGETQVTCPQDCGFPVNHCGNGACEPQYAESATACAADCYAPVSCGDGVCGADESAASCAADCTDDGNGGGSLNLGGYIVPVIAVGIAGLALWVIWGRKK